MTTSAPLRRTVRRCTTVIVLAVGIASGSVADSNDWAPALLVVSPGVFLLESLVDTPAWAVDEPERE